MNLSELKDIVEGDTIVISDESVNLLLGFASDLMSDALALIQEHHEETLLITGLCNSQSIRTADMLDIKNILIVRNKKLMEEEIELAQELGLNVLSTPLTMFETCGRLYAKGIKNV